MRFTRGDVGRHTGPTTSYQTCAVVGDSGEKYGARGAATGQPALAIEPAAALLRLCMTAYLPIRPFCWRRRHNAGRVQVRAGLSEERKTVLLPIHHTLWNLPYATDAREAESDTVRYVHDGQCERSGSGGVRGWRVFATSLASGIKRLGSRVKGPWCVSPAIRRSGIKMNDARSTAKEGENEESAQGTSRI